MKKKALTLILALAVSLSLLPMATAMENGGGDVSDGEFVIHMVPNCDTVEPGSTVTFDMVFENCPGVLAINGGIVYDKSMLELTGFVLGQDFRANGGSFLGNPASDCFTWDALNDVRTDGVFCTMSFRVLDTVSDGAVIEGPNFSVGNEGCVANATQELSFRMTTQSITVAHHFDQCTVKVQPNCTKDGIMEYTCACGATKTEPIPALGHAIVEVAPQDPSCTEDGFIGETYCSVCGTILTEREIIPATGHFYVDTTINPTCTQRGYTQHICSVCGDSCMDNIVPAYYDVNADGKIDAEDLTMLIRHVSKIEPLTDEATLERVDYDENGLVDAADLIILATYLSEQSADNV